MRSILQRFALAITAVAGFCFVACESGVRHAETGATLQGTVTYGKEKITVAMIVAQGAEGISTAFIGPDGRYKIENAPLGEVKIGVNSEAGKGQMMSEIMAKSQGKSRGAVPKAIDLPPKYFNPETSGLKTTVKKGDNTYDIVIPK